MTTLGELYSNFLRIDLDTRGGYARVAEVTTHIKGKPELCAFKLMRHENDFSKGMERFEEELSLLIKMTADPKAPVAITKIYDSGFVPVELSHALQKRETPNLELEIISTGTEVKTFLQKKFELQTKEANSWLPYLVVELAPFDDSLLRQIQNQPKDDPSGLFRFPTGEVIAMSLQLLDVMQYIHTKHQRAYMDWKPEHIYWNGRERQVKLIDWNVTTGLKDGPGEQQNIKDDLRLLCGAALYIGLTFVDPDDPTKPIGPHPTQKLESPIPEIRPRYATDNPNFYQRDPMLDEHIKKIIRKGLDPKQGFDSVLNLKETLLEYAEEELGMIETEITSQSEPVSLYFRALEEVHLAQRQLFQAQQNLTDAVRQNGSKLEFTRMIESIKRALKNFPIS
jgi:serine/threonine protein kinase